MATVRGPRQARGRESDAPAPWSAELERRDRWRDEQWCVAPVPGARALKDYRCPGCDHEIRPGTPHVVVWPAYGERLGERRHWHTRCWQARDRRSPR